MTGWLEKAVGLAQIATALATVVLTIATVILVIFARTQLSQIQTQLENARVIDENSRKIESANLMLSFNERLRSARFSKLTNDIATGKHILKDRGGSFADAEIDDYLVMFDLLAELYEQQLISREMVFDAFSYDVKKAYEHPEIKQFIDQVRKEENDPNIYEGFERLARIVQAENRAKSL